MKLIRMATVGLSLDTFCRGVLSDLRDNEGYEIIALASPDSSLAALGEREGVRTIGVAMRRDISPLSDLVSLWRLVKVLRRERPDMLHTMTPKAGLLGMMAGRIARVPVRVHTFTGLLFPTATGLKRRLLTLTDRLTCACATNVIAEGQGVRSDLINNGITRKPVRVLGHGNVRGVDLDHYSPTPELRSEAKELRRRFDIPDNALVLIFIGRFVVDKGLHELLEALPIVRRAMPDTEIHLIMVGDIEGGKEDIPLSTIAGKPHIHLSGGWTGDVRPWLLAADLLVCPSYREGFPNVVLEAGALYLPSVVTDINGSREIITHGENGLIVPPRTVEPLARAIIDILSLTNEERKAIGRNARTNVETRFSRPYVIQCLKDFYKEFKFVEQ